jgi:phosphatidate phosphatase APP1
MIKHVLHRTAQSLENWLESKRGPQSAARVIEPYIGYTTTEALILRGRVLTATRRGVATANQSKVANFRQMTSLFLTNEVADAEVICDGVTARTDEEGYFTLTLPHTDDTGWIEKTVQMKDREDHAVCRALAPDPAARFAVISDIDDTVMETGAYSLARNLWTSLTGNAMTRNVYPDAVRFMGLMSDDGLNPIYYVSSSPWNLHHFLQTVFERNGLVPGPTFLRDLGISETQFIKGTHGDHKGASIDAILNGTGIGQAVLVGDTGQHDPTVYLDVIKRHPTRIKAVVLRQAGGPDSHTQSIIKEIAAQGVPVLRGSSFSGFAETILAQ